MSPSRKNRRISRRGHYIVYGRRPLGGQARPGNFYFAYQRIPPQAPRAPEETFEFVRTYLQRPTPPVFKKLRTAEPGDVSLRFELGH